MNPLNDILKEFDEKFAFPVVYKETGNTIVDFDYHSDERERVKTFLTTTFHKGAEWGREEVLNEITHDQVKLLDGFSHPKDCGFCARQTTHKSE